MNDTSLLLYLPFLFLLFFALLWTGVSALLSKIGGWSLLAERFPGKTIQLGGRHFRFASAIFRRFPLFPASYRGILFVSVDTEGLHLDIFFMFRVLSPPIFIPWRAVESVGEQKHLFGSYGVVHIKDCPVVLLFMGEAGRYIREAYAGAFQVKRG
ncbi:MAG: hypothetical protein FJZ79_02310 [Chlorobi bacterium]|nr:hypothetical protein [Chlorobiota bacterium]